MGIWVTVAGLKDVHYTSITPASTAFRGHDRLGLCRLLLFPSTLPSPLSLRRPSASSKSRRYPQWLLQSPRPSPPRWPPPADTLPGISTPRFLCPPGPAVRPSQTGRWIPCAASPASAATGSIRSRPADAAFPLPSTAAPPSPCAARSAASLLSPSSRSQYLSSIVRKGSFSLPFFAL